MILPQEKWFMFGLKLYSDIFLLQKNFHKLKMILISGKNTGRIPKQNILHSLVKITLYFTRLSFLQFLWHGMKVRKKNIVFHKTYLQMNFWILKERNFPKAGTGELMLMNSWKFSRQILYVILLRQTYLKTVTQIFTGKNSS